MENRSTHYGDITRWIEKVIESCETREQTFSTLKLIHNFEKQLQKKSIEKYGTEYVLQSPEIRSKIKQTNLQKYGVENPQQNKQINDKTQQTKKNRYAERHWIETSYERIKQKYLERLEEYNQNPKLCIECSASIAYTKKSANKFCSSSCNAKFNNRSRKVIKYCLFCHKELNAGKQYCSLTCQQNLKRQKSLEENKISSKSIKTFLIKKKNLL